MSAKSQLLPIIKISRDHTMRIGVCSTRKGDFLTLSLCGYDEDLRNHFSVRLNLDKVPAVINDLKRALHLADEQALHDGARAN